MAVVRIKEIINWAEENAFSFAYFGDAEAEITGFSSLIHYKDESITWINMGNPVPAGTLPRIRCAVIQKGVKEHPDNYFVCDRSKKLFFGILEHFFSGHRDGIAERQNTYIGENVTLGENVKIGCSCVLDGEIYIGDNTVIEHNVTIINRVNIGADCIIHAGTVIGKDGYGYSFDSSNTPQKVMHFGGVTIGDRVEIGANCTVDRGTIDDTTIGNDVKIDSLVVVAHNSVIGNAAMIVGGVTVGGSCEIGENSYIAPHATLRNKTKIGSNAFIGMGVITTGDIDDNAFIARPGDPVRKSKDYRRFI